MRVWNLPEAAQALMVGGGVEEEEEVEVEVKVEVNGVHNVQEVKEETFETDEKELGGDVVITKIVQKHKGEDNEQNYNDVSVPVVRDSRALHHHPVSTSVSGGSMGAPWCAGHAAML